MSQTSPLLNNLPLQSRISTDVRFWCTSGGATLVLLA